MRHDKSLPRATAALLGSLVFVALLIIALPKKPDPAEESAPMSKVAPKTRHQRDSKVETKPAPAVAESTAPAADPVAALDEVLAKADSGAAATREQMVARIVRIGPKALPLVVDKVCGAAREQAAQGDDSVQSDAAETAGDPQLDEMREAALHDSIAKFDPAQQLACIVDHATNAPLDVRIVLAGLIGEVDHPDAVRELIGVVRPIEAIQWQREYVRGPVTQAMSRRFSAHPESLPALRTRLKDEQPALLAVIAEACTRKPNSASVDLALSLLDRTPELDLDVLHALAHMNNSTPLAIDEARLERVRHKLSDPDAEIRRAAAAVAGALHDFDSIGELVGLLADPEHSVSSSAHWSLRAMVRLDRGEDLPGWNAWLAERARWHTENAPELLAQLASDDAGEVVKALGALLAEPQDRRELADAL